MFNRPNQGSGSAAPSPNSSGSIGSGGTGDPSIFESFVAKELMEKAKLYAQRNAIYKDNYKRFGPMVHAMMGEVHLTTTDDFTRFGILNMLWSKLGRYSTNFAKGGHDDSLDDIVVYAMMMKEVDTEARAKKEGA